jgi:hypothetical protein
MKQKDIALIIVIVFVSAVFSLVLSNMLITSPKHRQQQVEVVSPITSAFDTPDAKYFNGQSVDPTQLIQIGGNSNPDPFSSKQ